MSVVAGCSLLDGIQLMADARVTIQRSGCPDKHFDGVQKIFPIPPRAAIGFVGDVGVASTLLRNLLIAAHQHPRRESMTPFQFINWIQRFLRGGYCRLMERGNSPAVEFLLGIADPRFRNVIERVKVVELFDRLRKRSHGFSLPRLFLDLLGQPTEVTHFMVEGAPLGKLCALRAPEFRPWYVTPLGFQAIGSGAGVLEELDRHLEDLLGLWQGMPNMELHFLRQCMDSHIQASGNATIGGLCLGVRVGRGGPTLFGFNARRLADEKLEIELIPCDDGHWLQRNVTTGKEVTLRFPWELECGGPFQTFEDFKAFW